VLLLTFSRYVSPPTAWPKDCMVHYYNVNSPACPAKASQKKSRPPLRTTHLSGNTLVGLSGLNTYAVLYCIVDHAACFRQLLKFLSRVRERFEEIAKVPMLA